MFRSLFSSLFASRPQARTRSQVTFKPQLEALEHRSAPSGIHGSFDHDNVVAVVHPVHSIVQTQIDSPGAHQTAVLIG